MATIGVAINNMGHLTLENAIAFAIVMWVCFEFIKHTWNLIDKKTRKKSGRILS